VAKRLEEICQPEKIYIDEPTYRAVEPFVAATKVRNMGFAREADQELLDRLTTLEEKLAQGGESAELLYEIGNINFQLRDASVAIQFFERALELDPNSTQIKLAYADANIKKDEFEKIQLKGKLQKISVYEVTGIKDRWSDPAIIPPAIAAKYSSVASHIEIPEEVVLAVEALDGSVGHARVVALLSYAIADHMRLNEELKKTILHAGYLQDIGKEAVPHHILNRTGSLTEQESKLLEKYVHESVATLKRMGYGDPKLQEIVLHQHEMWNGNGYPNALTGEAIPLGARITAVAGAYSALTSWRPYREAWDARVALSELRKGVEKGRYDPRVLEALVEMLNGNS
jgi:HD-GYP domain-containing protein (c-di-GMP phosphodiesterase class II)